MEPWTGGFGGGGVGGVSRMCCVLVGMCVLLCVSSGGSRAQEHLEDVEDEKVCYGTNQGLVARGDSEFRYQQYKDLYTNCTYLVGNLELIFLESVGRNYDLSFLSTITQVTGYVLVVGVHANYLYLTNLKIIRGKTLFHYTKDGVTDDYSLFLAINYDKNDDNIGLKELRFTSLQEILAGKIFFLNNNQLCFEASINWEDINPYVKPPVRYLSDNNDYRRPCDMEEKCHANCFSNITKHRHCWGAGKDMCQKLTQGEACHPSCESRCYGKLPNQCCHQECAGGCTGPLKTDCFTCRNFIDDRQCVPYCPPAIIYDNRQMFNVRNPNAKFAFGGICVKECPGYLLQDSGSCVRACPEGKHAKDGKNCEPCDVTCPKTCKGTESSTFLTSRNLRNFTDCTTIDGNLRILKHSFIEDRHFNISPLHPSNLTVLRHVKEITGFLLIQSDHKDFTDLSFLSNLEIVNGRQLDGKNAINILGTPLKSLELTSLKHVANGDVMIFGNPSLCYAATINWTRLFYTNKQKAKINHNGNADNCSRKGFVCDVQCDSSGCWGKGANKCLNCLNYKFEEENLCLNSCQDRRMLYNTSDGKCKRCHPECNSSCSGPNNTQCDVCAHVAVVGADNLTRCLEKCPVSMYSDHRNVCQPCHPYCENYGCNGPNKTVGKDGCKTCAIGLQRKGGGGTITCLPPDTDSCEDGYHLTTVPASQLVNSSLKKCEPCHEFCQTCNGPGLSYCKECKYFRGLDDYCVKKCQTFSYEDLEKRECRRCHHECRGSCTGPTNTHCLSCNNYKVFLDGDTERFNCTAECPSSMPYTVRDVTQEDDNRNVCADESHPEVQEMLGAEDEQKKRRIIIIVVPTICGVLFLGLLLTLFGYYCQKRAKAKEKTAQLTARMTGYDETEPITPTNAQPDLAKLRLINESELRKGGIIGSGAFGTVYKGFWIPEGENVKIPVAIKVLQDGTSPSQNKELLEEARVMASVEHACCIRILAVCMSAQMMLITQLMPLGCLLDYVLKNKEHIGSKVLLNWCTQIAKGMSYLEERGIVHRDLAARNVLVQTPTQVKITDFGLAKLLDYNEDEYHAPGGKMPIKWLALECIQHRIFTHKSDVWSFGVTAWELFTYGQRPYDNIRARDVSSLLEKGERLPQPSICTIDVYMIMIKCWMLDAESRPSFKELAEEFAKMARDPGRYLVVQGDKLMRLPSHSYDKNELVRSVSVAADGPEEIVEAEDYLQPHDEPDCLPQIVTPRALIFENNNSASPLLPPGSTYPMKEFHKGEVGGLPWREKNYAHLDRAMEARKQREQCTANRGREDSFNSRYSSDPIKYFREKEEIEGLSSYPYPGTYQSHPMPVQQNGGVGLMPPARKAPLQLAVDEDNYLAPHSAATTSAPAPVLYTDLSDKGYYQNEKVFEEEPQETDSMLNPRVGPAVANPVYFDQDLPATEQDVWETKKSPVHNGLLLLPNGPSSHRTPNGRGPNPAPALKYSPFSPPPPASQIRHPLENGHNYYNDFSRSNPSSPPLPPPPSSTGSVGRGGNPVLVRDLLPSESQV